MYPMSRAKVAANADAYPTANIQPHLPKFCLKIPYPTVGIHVASSAVQKPTTLFKSGQKEGGS